MTDPSASRPKRLPQNPIRAYDLGFKNGEKEGMANARVSVLGWLQHQYIDADDRPDRDSPEAKYLLELVRKLAIFITEGVG